MSKYLKSRRLKGRVPDDRLSFGAKLVRDGYPFEDAARMARVSPGRLKRALGVDRKLTEGETMEYSELEERINRRAEQLAAQDRNQDYRRAAAAEIIDQMSTAELFEAPQPVQVSELAEIRRRQLAVALGEEPEDDYTLRIRARAEEKGISEAEAEQEMYDRGEIH